MVPNECQKNMIRNEGRKKEKRRDRRVVLTSERQPGEMFEQSSEESDRL
jgi:hypothetical protein